jgi:UDP-2,3-diacylglucosamine pyrophosphatase LpxH
MMVVKQIIGFAVQGVPVYYLPGNHDEMLRKFIDFEMGSLKIKNKLLLNLDGNKTWIFHGDVFDVVMQHSKWLAKLGAVGYDTLILINSFMNFFSEKMGKGKLSFSKKIKNSVKSAVKFINSFENTVCEIAAENKFDYVICGHIHHPEMREVATNKGKVMYLNSGDWIENLTALEYNNGKWRMYKYHEDLLAQSMDIIVEKKSKTKVSSEEIVKEFLSELR